MYLSAYWTENLNLMHRINEDFWTDIFVIKIRYKKKKDVFAVLSCNYNENKMMSNREIKSRKIWICSEQTCL